MTASYDGGAKWSSPIQVNDNGRAVDEFQPNLSVAAYGIVSDAFYDWRLACPSAGSSEGSAAGIALDPAASPQPRRRRPGDHADEPSGP